MAKFQFAQDRDAAMRLQGCVVNYGGEPAIVIEASVAQCSVMRIGGDDTFNVPTAELDLNPLRVGNIQTSKGYVHVERAPVRRWKQGLHQDNLRYMEMPWKVGNVNCNTEAFLNCLTDQYPVAVATIADVVDGKAVATAISKRWGVGMMEEVPHIFYKDIPVGVVDKGEIVLFKKYFYLREDLLEVLNV